MYSQESKRIMAKLAPTNNPEGERDSDVQVHDTDPEAVEVS